LAGASLSCSETANSIRAVDGKATNIPPPTGTGAGLVDTAGPGRSGARAASGGADAGQSPNPGSSTDRNHCWGDDLDCQRMIMVVPKPVYGSVDGPVHYPDHPFPMLQQRIIAGIRKFHWGLDNKF
jgi:hypothetical protein